MLAALAIEIQIHFSSAVRHNPVPPPPWEKRQVQSSPTFAARPFRNLRSGSAGHFVPITLVLNLVLASAARPNSAPIPSIALRRVSSNPALRHPPLSAARRLRSAGQSTASLGRARLGNHALPPTHSILGRVCSACVCVGAGFLDFPAFLLILLPEQRHRSDNGVCAKQRQALLCCLLLPASRTRGAGVLHSR